MDPAEFNDLYLWKPLDTLAFENKDTGLMGDFNISILQYNNNKFLGKIHSNFILPYVSSLSRNTPSSQTLIDIFSKQNWSREFFREYNNNFRPLCPISVVKKQQFV